MEAAAAAEARAGPRRRSPESRRGRVLAEPVPLGRTFSSFKTWAQTGIWKMYPGVNPQGSPRPPPASDTPAPWPWLPSSGGSRGGGRSGIQTPGSPHRRLPGRAPAVSAQTHPALGWCVPEAGGGTACGGKQQVSTRSSKQATPRPAWCPWASGRKEKPPAEVSVQRPPRA